MEPVELRIKKTIDNIEHRNLPLEFSIHLPKHNVPSHPSTSNISECIKSDESFREVEIILSISVLEIAKKFLEQHHLSIRKLKIHDGDEIYNVQSDYDWRRTFNKISILPSEMPNLDTLEIRNKYYQNHCIHFHSRLPALKYFTIDRHTSIYSYKNLNDLDRVINMCLLAQAVFNDNDSHEDDKNWCQITIYYDYLFVTKHNVHFRSSFSYELDLIVLHITYDNYQQYVAPRINEYHNLLKLVIVIRTFCYRSNEYYGFSSIQQIPWLSLLCFKWHGGYLSPINALLFERRFGYEVTFPSSLRHLVIEQFFNSMIAKKLATNCPNLESLNVSGSKILNEEAFLCVIKHLPNLQFLSLSKLESSINAYWHHFKETDLPNLLFLNLYGTIIPDLILKKIRFSRPNLIIRELHDPGPTDWIGDNLEGFACTKI